jgi:hypothetical protein
MSDPIDKIEMSHGFGDLGRLAVNAYEGALDEAKGDVVLASMACAALFKGMFQAKLESDEDDKNEEP